MPLPGLAGLTVFVRRHSPRYSMIYNVLGVDILLVLKNRVPSSSKTGCPWTRGAISDILRRKVINTVSI